MSEVDPDEVFNNYYYRANRKLLQLLCIWPYQKRALKFFVRTVIIATIHTMMIPQMIRAYEEWYEDERDIEIIIENFAGFVYFQGTMSKYYMYWVYEDKLKYLYEHITKDWKQITDAEEQAVLHSQANTARFLSVIYLAYCYIGGLCFIWSPSVVPAILDLIFPKNESRQKHLCYYAEYYIDEQEYLSYLLLHTFVAVSFTILIVTAVDCTYVSVVLHSIGLFKILDYRMKNLFEYVQDKFRQNTKFSDDELHNYMIDSIKIHNDTIEFANLIQTSYTYCFFFVTGLAILFLSVASVDLMMNLNNPTNLFRIGLLWIGIIMYLFFVSWPGQSLMDCSQDLLKAIYSCGWYKFPLKTQFLIRFMMMRCIKPCQLTAGPLLVMNFETCGVVLNTAMSYFAVVASFS